MVFAQAVVERCLLIFHVFFPHSPGAAESIAKCLSIPLHTWPAQSRPRYKLEKQRAAAAAAPLPANLYAFQWGGLYPPQSACVPGKTKPSPNNESQPYFTQHFEFAFVTQARTRWLHWGLRGIGVKGRKECVCLFVGHELSR